MSTSPPLSVLPIAELVRSEAEAWAASMGYDDETLVTLCPAVSFSFARLARAVGLDAEVAMGHHDACRGHFWAIVAERQGQRPRRWQSWTPASARWAREEATCVDLTATQFDMIPRPPRIVVVGAGAMRPAGYLLDDFGDDLVAAFLWDRDKPEIESLSRRVMIAAVGRGMGAVPAEPRELAGVD